MTEEPFPDFNKRENWYKHCVLRGSRSAKDPITYQQQLQAINSCFSHLKIMSSKKTHAVRGAGKYFDTAFLFLSCL